MRIHKVVGAAAPPMRLVAAHACSNSQITRSARSMITLRYRCMKRGWTLPMLCAAHGLLVRASSALDQLVNPNRGWYVTLGSIPPPFLRRKRSSIRQP